MKLTFLNASLLLAALGLAGVDGGPAGQVHSQASILAAAERMFLIAGDLEHYLDHGRRVDGDAEDAGEELKEEAREARNEIRKGKPAHRIYGDIKDMDKALIEINEELDHHRVDPVILHKLREARSALSELKHRAAY